MTDLIRIANLIAAVDKLARGMDVDQLRKLQEYAFDLLHGTDEEPTQEMPAHVGRML